MVSGGCIPQRCDQVDWCQVMTVRLLPSRLRSHSVQIVEVGGYCVFLVKAASEKIVGGLTVRQLIKLTWERNAHIDVVEFALNEDH